MIKIVKTVQAAPAAPAAGSSGNIGNPLLGDLGRFDTEGTAYFSQLLSVLVSIILIGGTIIFLFMFLFGGIRWITSGGDKANAEAARGILTNAIVGLIIMFATWAIIALVENVFGIGILSFNIPTIT